MMVCMEILKAALEAKYVNFGMIQVYKDPCLNDGIMSIIRMVKKYPLHVLMVKYIYFILCEF